MRRRLLPYLVLPLFVGLLGCGDPPAPPSNTPPSLSGITAQPASVAPGSTVALTLEASDPDGDALTYSWAQEPASPTGTFSSTSIANPTWTAPQVSAETSFRLTLTVSDGKASPITGSVTVTVRAPAPANRPPTVDATITGPSTLMAGDTATFSITASDPDGDTLTYSWEQTAPELNPGNWVGPRTGSSAQWYSPPIGEQTSFTFSVSVTDGESTPVVRTLTVPVSVPRYSDVQNVWNTVPSCTSCHGSQGQLNLGPAVSYSNLVGVAAIACSSLQLQRVTPFDPDKSVLVRKLEGTTCGNRMPRNDAAYFDRNPGLVVRVRSWIMAGAENN